MRLRRRWFLMHYFATLLTVLVVLALGGCNQPMQRNTQQAPPVAAEPAPAAPQAPPKILEMPSADSTSPQAVDINTATFDQLRKMPFIGDSFALKVIQGRPYKRKDELSTRNILPPHVYQKAKDYLVASGSR